MDKSPGLLKVRFLITILLLLSSTVIVSIVSLSVGSSDLTFSNIISALFSKGESDVFRNILFEIRIPRILLAIAVGGGLSVAGAAFQSLLMNPLAEPYILGISSGGTFGALLAVILGFGFFFIQLFSFVGCGVIVLVVFMVSKKYGIIDPNSMILSGVMVGAFFSSLILVMVNFLDSSFRTAVFWLLGSLSMADKLSVFIVFIVVIFLSIILIVDSNKMNLLSIGDEQAFHLGINVKYSRAKIYVLSSLIVGSLVSVSGIIGFVGLIVPHATRLIFGSDNRLVVPYSFFVGAIFLLISDVIARTIFSPVEIPIGAVTAFVGSPIFIYLLKRK